eukprot:s1352_g17.t1
MEAPRPDGAMPETVAVMPDDVEFDEEAHAAVQSGFRVARYRLEETVSIVQWLPVSGDVGGPPVPEPPLRGLLRGYMLSRQRRQFLHESLAAAGVELLVTPSDYENVHFFPASYAALAPLSPRAVWCPVDVTSDVAPGLFEECLEEVKGWGCRYVVLKDYVKSAKAGLCRQWRALVFGVDSGGPVCVGSVVQCLFEATDLL